MEMESGHERNLFERNQIEHSQLEFQHPFHQQTLRLLEKQSLVKELLLTMPEMAQRSLKIDDSVGSDCASQTLLGNHRKFERGKRLECLSLKGGIPQLHRAFYQLILLCVGDL